MRYELSNQWDANNPMVPNKPCGTLILTTGASEYQCGAARQLVQADELMAKDRPQLP
jgi:hypothetical protein